MSSEATVEIDFDKIVHSTFDKDGHVLAYKIDFGFGVEWIPADPCEVDEKNKIIEMPEALAAWKGLV